MIEALLGLLLRHGLTILGGILLNKGGLDPTAVASVCGAVSTVAGLGLSALNKIKVVAKIDAAADSYKSLNR